MGQWRPTAGPACEAGKCQCVPACEAQGRKVSTFLERERTSVKVAAMAPADIVRAEIAQVVPAPTPGVSHVCLACRSVAPHPGACCNRWRLRVSTADLVLDEAGKATDVRAAESPGMAAPRSRRLP